MISNIDRRNVDNCFKNLEKVKSIYLEKRCADTRDKLVYEIGNAVMLLVSEQVYEKDLDVCNHFKYWMKDFSRQVDRLNNKIFEKSDKQ